MTFTEAYEKGYEAVIAWMVEHASVSEGAAEEVLDELLKLHTHMLAEGLTEEAKRHPGTAGRSIKWAAGHLHAGVAE